MYGKVTRYFHDRKFGFIRGEDGNTYFIHHSKLNGEYIDAGYYVFFNKSLYCLLNSSSVFTSLKYFAISHNLLNKKV